MMSKKDAEKAVEGANGVTVSDVKDGDPNSKGKERVIAVDWALSKEWWEVEKVTLLEGNDAGECPDSDNPGDEGKDKNVGFHEDSGSDGEGTEDSDDDVDGIPDRPQLPPPETGNTVFIRNLPFTVTEDELRALYISCMDIVLTIQVYR